MKTIYLLVFVILFLAACRPSSHIPVMPCEPTFDGAFQAQVSTGLSFDHVETQAAFSVLPFLGLTGDYYWGNKGIEQFEYGANVFFPINKNKSWFVSFGAGKGDGIYKGDYPVSGSGGYDRYSMNTQFNWFYLQPCIYYKSKNEHKNYTFSISIKHEEISFSKYNVSYYSDRGTGYRAEYEKQNGFAIIRTPFFGYNVCYDNKPYFFQTQLGTRFRLKTFTPELTKSTGLWGAFMSDDGIAKYSSPFFNSFMLNITVGLRLDFFKLRARQKG